MAASLEGRTICAVSSPPGAGRRGVIRVSGPESAELVRRTVRVGGAPAPTGARAALHGRFLDGVGEQPVLLLWMPGPRSYTREDVAELHLPGSPPLLERALARLVELGARVAGPGEFTRRAFERGRIDLTRAEGVLELVEASGEAERRAATLLLAGGLERRVLPLRDGLEDLRALCEASLDFDESDTGHVPADELERLFDRVETGLADALGWETGRAGARGVPRVVLVGAPNAGKSTLFNRLAAGAPAPALVSDRAGTTRDVLEAPWEVAGVRCELLDAPGLEAAALGADRRAQELAGEQRGAADLLLWVVDATGADLESSSDAGSEPAPPRVLVWTKLDRTGAAPRPPDALRRRALAWVGSSPDDPAVPAALEAAAARALGLADGEGGAAPAPPGGSVARELGARHRAALREASEETRRAREALAAGAPLDLVAEALRDATRALDGIRGATTPEDLLDRIFARFCLGK